MFDPDERAEAEAEERDAERPYFRPSHTSTWPVSHDEHTFDPREDGYSDGALEGNDGWAAGRGQP